MQKQIAVVLIAILFIVIGLCGCNGFGQSGVTSLREIKDHPNTYLGKTITVEGYYSMGAIYSSNSPSNEVEAAEMLTTALIIENHDKTITLFEGGKYLFTGVLKEKTILYQSVIYLEVSKIELI